jgi:hypothetical protein
MNPRATFHDNEDNSDLDSEGSEHSLDEIFPIDWDDTSRVVGPIPQFMQTVLTELRDLISYAETRFHGDYIHLRWTTADGVERQIFLNTPNEEEAEESEEHAGKHWVIYEGCGRDALWSILVELGVEKERLDAGVHLSIMFTSNPYKPYSEMLYDQTHVVRSEEQWAEVKHLLTHRMPELAQSVENEADFAVSAESTTDAQSDMELSDEGQ